MGCWGWWPFKSPLLIGPLWTPKQTKKNGPQDLKKQRGSPSRRSLWEILQQGAGSSGALLRGLVATSEHAVEISAKGRDEPVVRNLPDVKPRTPLLGVSSSDIPLQGASSFCTPTAREDLGHLVSGVGGLRLEEALSGNWKRQEWGQAEQELGAFSNQGMWTRPSRKKPRPKPLRGQCRRAVPLQKPPELQKGPGTYKAELTNIKIANILKIR
jgi:hypothetical protein